MPQNNAGTGIRLGNIIVILAGVAALSATLLTTLSVWLQTKNYRKPLLQRYVVRILLIVPIYSAASWTSLVSIKASHWIDPFRDVYEAFTIYAFFQLLINFIGGERALIIMMHGRPPVSHPWPLSRCLPKVDISDPYTFLNIKRGIFQYTWLKPALAFASIIMKATGTYEESVISATSGYFWSGLIYNISITICLYALAMFWVCMLSDLKQFRPMPKFLCIKGIIFASYWQGFILSILVKIGVIPDGMKNYSATNLAAAIQDGLICFEMPAFAILHWYAFSWHDYADTTISAARMPVKYALRDAFGPRDLIQDAKETFAGSKYEYRQFDATDDVLAHEESDQRVARMMQGMRYGRSGKGKYWVSKANQADSNTPLLQSEHEEADDSISPNQDPEQSFPDYGTAQSGLGIAMDDEDENLYVTARELEFGDYNYPVITAHHATREDVLYGNPRIITAGTNRSVLDPASKNNRPRRKSKIKNIQESANKRGKRRSISSGKDSSTLEPDREERADDQLVDLIVEDHEAKETDRARAQKSGNPQWNKVDQKHFLRAYPERSQSEYILDVSETDNNANPIQQFSKTGDDEMERRQGSPDAGRSGRREHPNEDKSSSSTQVADYGEEANVWDTPKT
ncbi:MAG: hypothetical protein M1831_004416 [Alyxoria varia]|nr:MAG: hypothetical protein M1831_004416 [Alyxoria varia]